MNNPQYVYEFQYCPCIYESGYITVSIHISLKGAYDAMKQHRINNFMNWKKLPNQYRKDFLDTFGKDWSVHKKEILP